MLNVYARDDGIVPSDASVRIGTLAPAARSSSRVPHWNREHPGGHYDLLAGHHAPTRLLPGVAAWLIERNRRSRPA